MIPFLSRAFVVLALGALVSGCLTSSPERVAERNSERCVARGHQPNTKEFDDCMTRIETERGLRMQSRHQEMLERSAAPPSNRGY
jgi:hypothetical protein